MRTACSFFRVLGILFSLHLAAAPLLRAQDHPLFAFVDERGVVHITDRLGDVPEPYYGVYRAREAERQRQARQAGPPAQKPPTTSRDPRDSRPAEQSHVTEESGSASLAQQQARGEWQTLMSQWRTQLVESAAALHVAEQEAQSASNPLLKETPVGRARYQQTQEELMKKRAAAMEAREMVTKVLPERAKREHVPPQWLTL